MSNWDDYKKTARSRGALALKLYVVESTPMDDAKLVQAALPDHLAYQEEMEAKGALVLAGPLSDETGETMQGVGQIVYRAQTLEEARSFKLRRWMVNEGSLSVSLSLSGQRGVLS